MLSTIVRNPILVFLSFFVLLSVRHFVYSSATSLGSHGLSLFVAAVTLSKAKGLLDDNTL